MTLFNDRRPLHHLPTDEDYQTPLTKARVAEANKRFCSSGVPSVIHNDGEKAARVVKVATRERFKTRKNSGQDHESVGEYLEFLNEIAKQDI